MKLVTAIIQPDKLEEVREELIKAEIYRITVSRCTGRGRAEETDLYRVWIDDWSAKEIAGQHILEAYSDETGGVRLRCEIPKMIALNGENGLTSKNANQSVASLYYSIPFIEANGYFLPPAGADLSTPVSVNGTLWLDREFGNHQFREGLSGWDWFGLELPGGDALMLYVLKNADGSLISHSGGTWIPSNGSPEILSLDDYSVTVNDNWHSELTGVTYPAGWTIELPAQDMVLTVSPTQDDQELVTKRSTRVTYWEGAVSIERNGYDKKSFGYVELVGYDYSGE